MKKPSALIIGAVVLAAGVMLLVLGQRGSSTQQSALGSTTQANVLKQDLELPDVTLEKLGGGTISLSEYRGKKPVVLDFWASWCPNCRRDMPKLNGFYEKYKDQVEVIGINLQEPERTVADFIRSRKINFPVALDPQGLASSAFGIQYTNTHFLIDKEGKIVRMIPGDISESDFTSLIQ